MKHRYVAAITTTALVLGLAIGMVATYHAEVARRVPVAMHGTLDPVTGVVTDISLEYQAKRRTCEILKDVVFCPAPDGNPAPAARAVTP